MTILDNYAQASLKVERMVFHLVAPDPLRHPA
jgi:hypothetical protein